MEKKIPRVMIAGTGSGCGKTTTVCALLQAFQNRGMRTGSCKCGPDYIDPMFHSRIIGTKSSNLDSFFFSPNTLRYLLAEGSSDREITVMEGVMGYYDGMDFSSFQASSYEVGCITDSPVILVVGAKGASRSVLAVLEGFLRFAPDSGIAGVILNQCSAVTYPKLAEAILTRFSGKVEPLGFLPSMPSCALESRHLGLVTAEEVKGLKEKMEQLAQQAERTICLNRILEIAEASTPIVYEEVPVKRQQTKIRIAVARDLAFCFYYEDSLDLLRRMGAELISFSPLEDPSLPPQIDGLYLGGGYPELYRRQLSRNTSMRSSVRAAIQAGLPCIAECGGFMYLTEWIDDEPMVGVIPGRCYDTSHLQRFGYVTLTAKRDQLLCGKNGTIPGHEFHHWDIENPGDAFQAVKSSGKSWNCVHAGERLYAGFPHFHFYANPGFAKNFYEACIRFQKERE